LGNLKKHYIGSISSEKSAAKIYDCHAILSHGLRAKTNFSYTKLEITKILKNEFHDMTLEGKSISEDPIRHSEEGEVDQIN
jgi:hypothetical protein